MSEEQAMTESASEPWWVKAAQTLGVVTIAFFFLMYWADRTIKWEREQMIPAITNSANSAERNTEALGRIERVLVRLDDRAETPPHNTN